ncbi:MAG: LacI family DNA-binding transcriptional regulator [Gammaproteobacteria bacterium]
MSDVAARANVSKTTVSHVINETRFVEPETKQRVLQAVAELGYRPSTAARSLTTNRTETVGVIVSDSSNHFFAEVLRGIEDILRPKNYALLVCNTAEILEREAHYLDILMRQRVDGIIAAATSQRWDELTKVETLHIPVVFVDRIFEGLDGPFIGVDNEQGAYLGASHIIECGHRQIGILAGFQRLSTMRERLNGFQRALREHNIPLREEWIVASALNIEGAREAMRHLLTLAERPTAVFINNNLLTLGALLALKELGLHCPEDIGIVGFDDHPWAAVSAPPLTVVRQPAGQVGRAAAEMLLALINDEQVAEPRVIMDCELVSRQSCSPI